MSARPEHMDAQPIPGEACTELGFERSPAPRIPRLGAAGRRHCWVIKHQAWITAAAAMAAFALLVWAAK
jgi:hypothetical protein